MKLVEYVQLRFPQVHDGNLPQRQLSTFAQAPAPGQINFLFNNFKF